MYKVGGLMSDSFMMQITALYSERLMVQAKKEMDEGNFELLDQLHHLTSGLKAFFCLMTHEGVDELRRCCGGAGYSQWSLLPELSGFAAQMPTVEGDTVVMAAQSARYLFNKVKGLSKSKPTGLFDYINHLDSLCSSVSKATDIASFSDMDHLENAMAVRTAYWVRKLTRESAQLKKDGQHPNVFQNETHAQQIQHMSKAHMMYVTFKVGRMYLASTDYKCPNLKSVLTLVTKVFALKQLTLDSVPCFDSGFFSKGALDLLNDSMNAALIELRPHMIPLAEYKMPMDNWYTDISSIGNQYGDIYETQLNYAVNSRLNKTHSPDYFESLVMPMVRNAPSAKL